MATSDQVTTGADESGRVLTSSTLPYYLGGFLGPFGTVVVIAIYPELRATFDATSEQVNWAFSGYLLPMAALLLVAGTVGERLGRRRVTRVTFLAYAGASMICVVAPTLEFFVAGRVLQGAANAFVTPLLIAGLTEVTDPARLGRAIGVYSSFQAAGAALAPFVGGLLAVVDWRLVFVVVAVVALGLATRPPQGEPRPAAAAPPIRPLFSTRMVLLWVAAFSAAAGPLGIAVILGLYLRDELGAGSTAAGVVLLLGGLAPMVLGPVWGRLLDSWGAVRSSAVSVTALVAVMAPLGLLTNIAAVTLVWTVGAALVGFVVIITQQLSAIAVPDNRGGALSTVMSFRFVGHAIGPLVFVPIVADDSALAFAGAAGFGLFTLVSLVAAARRIEPGS
ncbi:MAG: MFS transporter [Ilumatobacteraceae bacterium]